MATKCESTSAEVTTNPLFQGAGTSVCLGLAFECLVSMRAQFRAIIVKFTAK